MENVCGSIFVHLKECEREADEIVAKECTLLPSWGGGEGRWLLVIVILQVRVLRR